MCAHLRPASLRAFATSSLHASKGEIVAVRLGPLVPIGPLDSRWPRRIVGAGERATHRAVSEPRALHAARWLYFASRFEKEGDAIARDGRLQNKIKIKLIFKKEGDAIAREPAECGGRYVCIKKKTNVRIWADMHVAHVSTFGGRPFLCGHKYAEESVCVPWGTEGEHANPCVVRWSSGFTNARGVRGAKGFQRAGGGRD